MKDELEIEIGRLQEKIDSLEVAKILHELIPIISRFYIAVYDTGLKDGMMWKKERCKKLEEALEVAIDAFEDDEGFQFGWDVSRLRNVLLERE